MMPRMMHCLNTVEVFVKQGVCAIHVIFVYMQEIKTKVEQTEPWQGYDMHHTIFTCIKVHALLIGGQV